MESTKSKVLGPTKSFVKLVDEALLAAAEEAKKGKGYYPLRPSAAGYCGRKLGYDLSAYKGYSEKIHEDRKPSVIRLLSLGHTIEYQALKELEQIPGFSVKFKQQVVEMFSLPSGQIIEGSTDAVMWSEEHKALLDVKSVGLRYHSAFGNSWNSLKEKYDRMASMEKFDDNAWYIEDVEEFLKEIGEDSLVANIYQINLYACTEFMKKRGVNVGVVYRYCKSNSETMEIRFKPSQALFERVKAKYSLIEEKVEARDLEAIPKDFVLGSQACAFCPYQSKCWPDANSKKEYFKTFPKKTWPTDIGRAQDSVGLTTLFNKLSEYKNATDNKAVVEAEILKKMQFEGLDKIRLEDGSIYQAVFLKSPKPHFELRRVAE